MKTIAVVGAGIIGIACAHYLAADGRKVIVLDKGTIAGGCSSKNCGHVIPSHVLPLNSPGAIKEAFKSIFDRDAPFLVKPQISFRIRITGFCNLQEDLRGAACSKMEIT